jgi:hypothetical protein
VVGSGFAQPTTCAITSPLELVHNDLTGPFPHPSINNAKYVLTFIDDWSRYMWVYFLKQKYEVLEHFKEFKAYVEKQSRKMIKILHTNNMEST